MDINTGTTPHASVKGKPSLRPLRSFEIILVTFRFTFTGCYPLIGWRLKDSLVYLAEGAANDTATIINWASEVGTFT